jgi:hypothetical protein
MRTKKTWIKLGLLALVVTTLTGCKGDATSYSLEESSTDKAITIVRDQPWPWSDWEVTVIITNAPDCARRYLMTKTSTEGSFKLDLYQSYEGGYIMSLRKKWYVTDFTKCQFQAYKEPPPEPGDLLGSFREQGGDFTFVANKDTAAKETVSPGVAAPTVAAEPVLESGQVAGEAVENSQAGNAAAAMAR